MYKLKRYLPLPARLVIYHSLVQSHLNFCNLVWGFASKSHIDSLFCKQKIALRTVMPGYINYRYNDGQLPAHTKQSFNEYNILTVHGIISKNALVFMHKIRHFSSLLPQSIRETIHSNAPIIGSDHVSCTTWLEIYGRIPYCHSLFYKGPLLAISQENISATTLPSLLSIKIYKKSVKSLFITLQSQGDGDEWPTFLLHNIQGLRRSTRR